MLNRHITQRFLRLLGQTDRGAITVTTPDGHSHHFKGTQPGAIAHIDLHDWYVVGAMLSRGDIALAETYRDGRWDSPDPAQLFLFGLQNEARLARYLYGHDVSKLIARLTYLFTRNTLKGSQKNIHAHYDLGNDFYALWLDPSMTYSSALYQRVDEPLQDAQIRKYDRLLSRLNPTGSLLEIGCGWGGFAERALQKGDYGIKGLTISQAQHAFAQKRVGQAATIALEDYRHQHGRYDQIVSIEMFEAVGETFWPVYFAKLKTLLAQHGKALIQTITMDDVFFDLYRESGDAIRSFIFPGGMLPSPARFREESRKAGLQVVDEFAFGQDYALTLTQWLNNFDSKIKDVAALGFSQQFIRLWRFYLTYCMAAFRHGRTNVIQWELQHAT